MTDYYILDEDRNVIPTDDVRVWGRWFEENYNNRTVNRTTLPDGGYVSTVFIGIDHNWGGPPPHIFETMVFDDGDKDIYSCRCSTWSEALRQHDEAVEWALKNDQ